MIRSQIVRRRHGAFTLVELLVVVAIIALLASILFPAFQLVRDKARAASCQSNMKQIGLGLIQYCQDYDEGLVFPYYGQNARTSGPSQDLYSGYMWMDAIYPYVKGAGIFDCPSMAWDKITTDNAPFQYSDPAGPGIRGTYMKYVGSYAINATYQRYANSVGYATLPPTTSVPLYNMDGSTINSNLPSGSSSGYVAVLPSIPSPTTTVWVTENVESTNSAINLGANVFSAIQNNLLPKGFTVSSTAGFNDVPAIVSNVNNCDISFRHEGVSNVLFFDGHVKAMVPSQLFLLSNKNNNMYAYFTSWDDGQ